MTSMKNFISFCVFSGLLLIAVPAVAKLSILVPASQGWLPPPDGWITFEVSGKTQDLPAGTEIVLSIDKLRKKSQTHGKRG